MRDGFPVFIDIGHLFEFLDGAMSVLAQKFNQLKRVLCKSVDLGTVTGGGDQDPIDTFGFCLIQKIYLALFS